MNRLQKERLDARMTQEQLADESGVSIWTIRRLEAGTVKNPSDETLFPLCDVLKLSPSELKQSFREQAAA